MIWCRAWLPIAREKEVTCDTIISWFNSRDRSYRSLFDENVLTSGELRVLTFSGYSREWADFIFLNRNSKTAFTVHDYDIVYGPIANDRVGVQIGKYEAGDITLDQFLQNLKYMKGVTFQYYFGTERAISKLTKI